MEDDGGSSHTYGHLLADLESWRARLDDLRVEPGMVVGLRADYSVQAVAAQLALMYQRAVVALLPRGGSQGRYLADAHAVAMLDIQADGRYEWQARPCLESHPLLESLRAAGDGGMVLFTSGSTGSPKAALQSSERFLSKFRKRGRQFRTLAFLLFDHIAGQDTLFYTLSNGGTLVFTRRRDPSSILKLIETHAVEVLPTSPSFLRLLCASKLARDHDLSSLKIITYGSEPMDPSTLFRLNDQFPGVQLRQKYGATEAGSPPSVSKGNKSLWLKFKRDSTEVRIVDGVLWIRNEGIILGYLNAPSPITDDGWYCTGDLVDVEGEWIRFRGRAVHMINVGGEKVSPAEVEHAILELEFVREVVVTGAAHTLLGQVVTARVSLTTQHIEPKDAIRRIWRHCRQRLAPYKAPVKIDISSDALTNDRQKAVR